MSLFGRKKSGGPTIRDILHGCTPLRMQSAGLMQVIPLASELDDGRFVPPPGHALVATTAYGVLAFNNQSERLLLVPSQVAYVVGERVQDHALPAGGLVKGKARREFRNAMCVQQSQPGLIREGEHPLSFLPLGLRETALDGRRETVYDRLWSHIAAFNDSAGVEKHGNLVAFLNHYEQELSQFVAEFECLPEQVGAIVLIDGRVAGIERAPSRAYWRAVWEPLIRTCYGAQAIVAARRKGEQGGPPPTRVPLDAAGVESLDGLAEALRRARKAEEQVVQQTIRDLLDDPFEVAPDSDRVSGIAMETVRNAQFVGQVAREDERIVYASLVVATEWARRQGWARAKPFDI